MVIKINSTDSQFITAFFCVDYINLLILCIYKHFGSLQYFNVNISLTTLFFWKYFMLYSIKPSVSNCGQR